MNLLDLLKLAASQGGNNQPPQQQQNPVPGYVQQQIAKLLAQKQQQANGGALPQLPSPPLPQGLQGGAASNPGLMQQLMQILGGQGQGSGQ